MNRSDLCKHLAVNTSLTNADAAGALDAVISTIADALAAGETVTIAGFGKFNTKDRAARHGRNPRTGEAVAVPAARVPSFKAGKSLRHVLNR